MKTAGSAGVDFATIVSMLASSGDDHRFKVSPDPFFISPDELEFLKALGPALQLFYKGANRLYRLSAKGKQPGWISRYLDIGKPDHLLKLGRMNRFKNHLPMIIRPDIILGEDGYTICELDSVPGGLGTVSCLASIYPDTVGAGVVNCFYAMLQLLTDVDEPAVAVVISKESADYRPEMEFLVKHIREQLQVAGLYIVSPEDIIFYEDGLYIRDEHDSELKLDGIYRFFELFDLDNIPKSELLSYAVKKNRVAVTPPYKPYLEEKMLLALFHHPALKAYWVAELGESCFELLKPVFPETWVIDSASAPPYSVIPGLEKGGSLVSNWDELMDSTKKEREFALKISGFSPDGWGSRGVYIGHDMSADAWASALKDAIESFGKNPYVLQKFYKGRRVEIETCEPGGAVSHMEGRVRLSPYYFTTGDGPELGAVLATVCPPDKVLIHGMSNAVMMPVALERG